VLKGRISRHGDGCVLEATISNEGAACFGIFAIIFFAVLAAIAALTGVGGAVGHWYWRVMILALAPLLIWIAAAEARRHRALFNTSVSDLLTEIEKALLHESHHTTGEISKEDAGENESTNKRPSGAE
jgi:hypothetical protein